MLFLPNWKLNPSHPSPLNTIPTRRKSWQPPALQRWNLLLAAIICWTLIAILQYLLAKSQKDSGILFAENVNNLPLHRSFMHLYMPTIVAVLFSIYWAWIDLDAKRSEPYYQLTKRNGALGNDSLLLHYPFDFIPLVPLIALKRRHWLVLCTSLSTVLLTFGVIPIQAGIFSSTQVSRTVKADFVLSANTLHVSNQSTGYTGSVYNIATFNETLPPYMTRDYVLRPFTAIEDDTTLNTTWTAQTTLYSLDLNCTRPKTRQVVLGPENSELDFEQDGCRLRIQRFYHYPDLQPFFALQRGRDGDGRLERFTDVVCNPYRHMFLIAYVRSDPFEATSLFCDILYYEQSVQAIVAKNSKTPLDFRPLGPKRALSPNVFNIPTFERAISLDISPRAAGALPVVPSLDDSWKKIANDNMIKLANLTCGRPVIDFMNPNDLADCYSRAFRLFFARAMTVVLEPNFNNTTSIEGDTTMTTEAVVVQQVFTHVAQGLLALVSISAVTLMVFTFYRGGNLFCDRLFSDPGTIASVMSLSSDNDDLLAKMQDLDHCAMGQIEDELKSSRFELLDVGYHTEHTLMSGQSTSSDSNSTQGHEKVPKAITDTVRPLEFHLGVAVLFVGFFATLIVTLAVLYVKSRLNGLPLPSKNKVVQNLIRSYLPTAIATLIEPMWILINRLLCMLQPIESLLSMEATARLSININYNSLPSQLTLFTALRSKHFMLASVCVMVLLANLLAITFSGLFFQDLQIISKEAEFRLLWNPRSPASLTRADNYTFRGPVLFADSNLTAGTQLPPWTDEHRLYVPFQVDPIGRTRQNATSRANTKAIGMEAECEDLRLGTDYDLSLSLPIIQPVLNLSITTKPNGKLANCLATAILRLKIDTQEALTMDMQEDLPCHTGQLGAEFVLGFSSAGDSTTPAEIARCKSNVILGWIRLPADTPIPCDTFRAFNYLAGRPLDQGDRSSPLPWSADITNFQVEARHMKFMTCKPKLVFGDATVTVDKSGYITTPIRDFQAQGGERLSLLQQFGWDQEDSPAGQALKAVTKLRYGGIDETPFHNDTFANDPFNYFMRRETNNSRFTDPAQPLPELSEVEPALSKTMARLGAILLGLDKELLLQPSNSSDILRGHILFEEERLLMKKSLFIISEIILSLYVITAILVFINRPKKYLPRLPHSIAAIISLFAASSAVRDLRGTSQFTTKERTEFLDKSGFVYGYGSYTGVDGGVHVGIERAPFLRRRTTGRSRIGTFFSSSTFSSKAKSWF
ncbi:hypothetical protein P154DRAFT_566157 [Amniculicola lignicola CBS 123094]|uniref:Uncharacterized protein n=1 Tax=Amniculicola lignicola CBS 123094 TaxID=1392246 RepID=A0A6A5W601_9PLEO|nr:hypothetical protein P154DRAFT_566157 [Amniculicola lignicola CBS 123094]